MAASFSPLMVSASSFPGGEEPLISEQQIQILRSTTAEQCRMIKQCCAILTAIPGPNFTPIEIGKLTQLQKFAMTYLCQNPEMRLRAAFAIRHFSKIQQQQPGLETQFSQEVLTIDLTNKPNFKDFIRPNERQPSKIVPHLAMSQPGLIVSTGTERSFFDLALSDPTKCEGLVVRDFNPLVKAYVDFNVMLLRIAQNREHYRELSAQPELPEYASSSGFDRDAFMAEQRREKLQKIRIIVELANLPPDMKAYYLKNLDAFGQIYFDATLQIDWRKQLGAFNGVKYHEDDQLFDKLQRYARSGNIIATVGSIGELQFLNHRNVGIVDISNIPDYSILEFKTRSNPKIISTEVCPPIYRASIYRPLTQEESEELSNLMTIFKAAHEKSSSKYFFGYWLTKTVLGIDEHERDSSLYYCSRKLLDALKIKSSSN
jgi:hypothetical protein